MSRPAESVGNSLAEEGAGGLAELPANLHGDDDAVLAALRRRPCFSAFTVTTTKLARTLDRLHDSGRIEYDRSAGYPLVRAVLLGPPE